MGSDYEVDGTRMGEQVHCGFAVHEGFAGGGNTRGLA